LIADQRAADRLEPLLRLLERELAHLLATDRRLFTLPFTAGRVESLNENEDMAERIDAFVSRFSRLQDTLGDKVIPAWLAAHGERPASFADNRAGQSDWG